MTQPLQISSTRERTRMAFELRDQTAIDGIGQSEYGRFLPDSQLALGATALKAALNDAGLKREDIDGLAIHMGWPLGADYDRIAETYGLDIRWVSQSWLPGIEAATASVIAGVQE